MHNLATGAILIKMSGILALRTIQATFFHESGLLVNKSTFVLLRNVPKTLKLESEPLTLPHYVIGVFTPMSCWPKLTDGRRQATREPGGPEPLSVGPAARTRPEVEVHWTCHLTYTWLGRCLMCFN
jgi:hypothetical protein